MASNSHSSFSRTGPIEAWGLYRIVRSVAATRVTGRLDLEYEGGTVGFWLKFGQIVEVHSSIASLVPPGVETAGSRFRAIRVSSVLSTVLPLPARSWTFQTFESLPIQPIETPIDPLPELVRAVRRSADARALMSALETMDLAVLSPGAGLDAVLSIARTVIGETRVAGLVRQQRLNEARDAARTDPAGARTLFAVVVAGALMRAGQRAPDELPGRIDDCPQPAPVEPEPSDPAVRGSSLPPGMAAAALLHRARKIVGVPPDEELLAIARRVTPTSTFYDFLEIPPGACLSLVRNACNELLKRTDRSRFGDRMPDDQMQVLAAVHKRIERARDVLTDRTRRAAHNRGLGLESRDIESRTLAIFDARDVWELGMRLFQAQRHSEALARFAEAARIDPTEPEYLTAQAWTMAALPPGRASIQRARELIEEALAMQPELLDGHVLIANLLQKEGAIPRARYHVKRALAIEPRHAEAAALDAILGNGPEEPPPRIVKKDSIFRKIKGMFE